MNFNGKEQMKCVLMGCKDVIPQNLGEIMKDDKYDKRIIKQAILLIEMGFEKTDYFCRECFWK